MDNLSLYGVLLVGFHNAPLQLSVVEQDQLAGSNVLRKLIISPDLDFFTRFKMLLDRKSDDVPFIDDGACGYRPHADFGSLQVGRDAPAGSQSLITLADH